MGDSVDVEMFFVVVDFLVVFDEYDVEFGGFVL